MKNILSVLAALALVLSTTTAEARRCGGVNFPGQVTVSGTQLTLNGLGIREATVFNVDVYVAALYVEATGHDGNALSDSETKKSLVLRFVRDVDGSDIQEAWTEGFQHQGHASSYRAQMRRLNGWMSDMSDGDSMTFTYEPGTGLTVSVRGQRKGTIEGAEFAHAFFRIWLGSHPPNRGLKVGLLGGHCG